MKRAILTAAIVIGLSLAVGRTANALSYVNTGEYYNCLANHSAQCGYTCGGDGSCGVIPAQPAQNSCGCPSDAPIYQNNHGAQAAQGHQPVVISPNHFTPTTSTNPFITLPGYPATGTTLTPVVPPTTTTPVGGVAPHTTSAIPQLPGF